MALLQELIQAQNQQLRIQQGNNDQWVGLKPGDAYASYFPTWEVTAPQYPVPAAWSLHQLGYRTNEVAYACINLLMKTISEPPTCVWDKKKDEPLEGDHPYTEFMNEPCPGLTENDFISAVVLFLNSSGVMAWEKEHNNDGSLRALWPMMPQYCSYMRGEKKLLATIRYQPYTGLPYLDVPVERILYFMYPDPQYYELKPLSPTAVIADVLGIDTKMTTLIDRFIKNGAFISGQLVTDQVINAEDARFAKERFRESHGGPENAGDVLVTGKGLKFERMNNTFREMVFPEVDARSETRICMNYGVPPIMISAKSGMDRSTYSNYEQARAAFYQEKITSEWRYIESRLTRQLLREFDDDPNHVIRFDLSRIKALQEDRNSQWNRAVQAYKERVIVRNDALKEMGLPALVDATLGNEYFQTVMSQSSTTNDLDIADNSQTPKEAGKEKPQPPTDEQKAEERKNFIAFAKRRVKENKRADIPEYEFKYLDPDEQRRLLNQFDVPDADAEMVMKSLLQALTFQPAPQNINITAQIQPGAAPNVTVENNIPETKAPKLPAPVVNVSVEPTPVEVKSSPLIEVNVPKLKSSRSVESVKRDAANNIDGKIGETSYEYEE